MMTGCSGGASPAPSSSVPAASSAAPGAPGAPGAATPSGPVPVAELRATADGLGPARVGLPVARFAAALGRRVGPPADPTASQGCWYRELTGLTGVRLMVLDRVDGAVRRVDVDVPGLRTEAGVGVGSTVAEVTAAYPGVVTQPHKYVSGASYLTVHAGGHDLLFETDAGGRVTTYRFGEPDPVSWVEGCS